MSEFAIKILSSYLLGSVIGSLVAGRFRGGVDIRSLGSGNAGSTNALRTQGKAFAIWVVIIDVVKGWLATRVVATLALSMVAPVSPELRQWLPVACGIAAIVGHVYPVWYGFRGGKGAATLVGALLGLEPWLVVPEILVWLAVAVLTGFVGLSTIAAAVALPIVVAASSVQPHAPLFAFAVFVALFVAFTHRSNVLRMRAGTEPRARRLWLLGRREPR